MRCLFCKGTLEDKESTFTLDNDGCIIIVRDVPGHVCCQCGEASFDDEVYRRLEKIVDQMRGTISEVSIVSYAGKIA